MSPGGTTVPTPGSRINWQLLIAAFGFMLTMSVALATGLVGRDRGPAQPEIVQAANITVNPTPVVSHRPQVVTVVILGSDAEANALRVTIHDYTRDDPDLVIDQKWTYIEVVETAEEETELRSMLDGTRADLAEDGIDLQVLDLR